MASMDSIKGFILDMDGTLIDSMPIWDVLGERYLSLKGIEAEKGLGKLLYPMSLEESSHYLKTHYGLMESEADIRAGFMDIVKHFYYDEVKEKEGALAFVSSCKERGDIVVATTSPMDYAQAALSRLGILPYISRIFTCSELQTTKKEPFIYERAAEFLGLSAGECLVAEDMLHALLVAKSAGFMTLGVYDASADKDQESLIKEADFYVRDLRNFWENNKSK